MNIDPTKQDMWVVPLVGIGWHLWRAGNPESVCGLPWSVAAQAWDTAAEQPKDANAIICEQCSAHSKSGGESK